MALPSEGDEKPPRGVKRSLASSFHSAKSASHDGVATTTKASKKLEGDRSTDDANSTRAGSRVSKKAAGPSNGRASKASNGSKNDAAGKAKGFGCPKVSDEQDWLLEVPSLRLCPRRQERPAIQEAVDLIDVS